MLFSEKIKNNVEVFLQKVYAISDLLNINPDWLMAAMYLESSINPAAVNRVTGATGLIQFMPSTANSLGTTTTELATMSNVDQLDYVYKYLKPYAGRMEQLVDVYFAIFFPAAIGKADDYVLQTNNLSAKTIATANSGYDLNKDNQLTVGEVKEAIYNRLGIVEEVNESGEIVVVKKKIING